MSRRLVTNVGFGMSSLTDMDTDATFCFLVSSPESVQTNSDARKHTECSAPHTTISVLLAHKRSLFLRQWPGGACLSSISGCLESRPRQAYGHQCRQCWTAAAQVVDPNRCIDQYYRLPSRRRATLSSCGSIPPSRARRRALSRWIRALSPSLSRPLRCLMAGLRRYDSRSAGPATEGLVLKRVLSPGSAACSVPQGRSK